MFKAIRILLLVLIFVVSLAARSTVNSSIRVHDGQTLSESLRSVNGGIRIGEDCHIEGSARTVNGSIHVGSHSHTGSLKTVNGKIRLGEEVTVTGFLRTVNGGIRTLRGCGIGSHLSSVNGSISLDETRVEAGISTCNGDISLERNSRVIGDITIKRRGWSFFDLFRSRSRVRVYIRSGSVVEGDIINTSRKTDLEVILEEGGRIKGEVRGGRIVRK